VGEIQDEYDEEVPVVEKLSDFEFKVSTAASILDVNDFLPYHLPEGEDYETVGGLINVIYGTIPEVGDSAVFQEYEFKVLEKSQRNIESVLLTITDDKRDDIL
jgi:CBS domain containing-hemolysin-like protein